MGDNLIIGLDIGSSHVRAVAGRQNNGQLDIIATGKSNTSGYLLIICLFMLGIYVNNSSEFIPGMGNSLAG